MQSEAKLGPVINLAFYKFVHLADPQDWRKRIQSMADQLGLKGTVLLAQEGINAMLAGPTDLGESFAQQLQKFSPFDPLVIKRTYSEEIPFKKLLVKVKKEIVTFRQGEIDVDALAAPYVKPMELKSMIERGENIILVDTRNDFEVRMGTFKGAINPEIPSFSRFAEYLESHGDKLKGKKIVTFCTGGIRCEKATAFMRLKGYENVVQLEGGILEYLRQTGGDHFEGKCFVFDERITL